MLEEQKAEGKLLRYRVRKHMYASEFPIVVKEFDRETSKFLVNSYGRRVAKVSDYEKYFVSYEDAREYVLRVTLEKVHWAKAEMERQEERLNAFTRMLPEQEPEGIKVLKRVG